MPVMMRQLLERYVTGIREIYGSALKAVILYGSYARGDFRPDSDIDLMILIDLSEAEIEEYRHQLSGYTYDFNEAYDLDIKPIAKSSLHFQKWMAAYPFYRNVSREGVALYGTV